jgi:hypothetical protein
MRLRCWADLISLCAHIVEERAIRSIPGIHTGDWFRSRCFGVRVGTYCPYWGRYRVATIGAKLSVDCNWFSTVTARGGARPMLYVMSGFQETIDEMCKFMLELLFKYREHNPSFLHYNCHTIRYGEQRIV